MPNLNELVSKIIEKIPADYHYLRKSEGGTNTWVDKSALYDPETEWRGKDHFVFGGILQSVTENKGQGGLPTYSVNVTDPREILSNVTVILSDYAGSVFGQQNMLNVFGFLEYEILFTYINFCCMCSKYCSSKILHW